ncbi:MULTISPECIES: DUF4239 domain-containing protein [Streptomyces]|uniref:DUF4239 domain-containing protein n=1 Tax=Streptomyces lycii TaxID=2654337 RepID=A0ABQ7FN53_9ACTN|nr:MULTISPECIES: DUF4239 domain-containing protein [Streptomyces]KAF4409835.1 DUF4239 domain-containing protein [Streptomyces lycii]PGH52037.1 hypothetical protein CRI70_03545 [Streptomyces sp. Ru87]
MPQWLVLTVAMAAACVVVLVSVSLYQRRVGEDDDPSGTPDVIEYMTMMIGVVYAIVLGLAIAGVWEARGAAEDGVRTEAQALHEVSERAEVLPAEVRQRVDRDIEAYVRHVVRVEWPYMAAHGELTGRGAELLDRVRADVARYEPRGELESLVHQPLADQVAAADAARSARAASAGATMPGVIWFGLITGGLVTVGMVFALQIRRSARELLLAGLFSALIAFLLFVIWHFDAPLGRGVPDAAAPFLDHFPGALGPG